MKNYKIWLILIVMCLVLGTGWIVQIRYNTPQIIFADVEPIPSYQIENRETPLKIAMISVLNHKDTARDQSQLAEGIGRKLGRPVLLLHRKSYAEVNHLLSKGDADIALLSTGAYCIYGKKEGFVLLAMQERNQLPYYYTYIIVPAQSTISSLDGLENKSFAYVDPLSYSGYLGLQEKLQNNGFTSDQYFKSTYFTYSHDESIRAVANQFVDGAVVDSLAYDYLKKHEPELVEKIKIIETLPPMGTGPIVARKDLDNIDRIQEVLLHLHEDPITQKALHHLMIDRFILPQPELYLKIDSQGIKR